MFAEMKGQTRKRQAAQRLRIYSSLIRFAIWSGRALSLGTKVTTNDNFCASFKTLSFHQPVYSQFAANEGTKPYSDGEYVYISLYNFIHSQIQKPLTVCFTLNGIIRRELLNNIYKNKLISYS